jgi:hypothetical protein
MSGMRAGGMNMNMPSMQSMSMSMAGMSMPSMPSMPSSTAFKSKLSFMRGDSADADKSKGCVCCLHPHLAVALRFRLS